MVKGFGMPVEQVLYELSYANIVLLSSTLPSYDRERGEGKEEEKTLDMSDPEDQDKIDELLGIKH
nr:MAG TPA: hypothetical protein [Caudoviricetes sp.]